MRYLDTLWEVVFYKAFFIRKREKMDLDEYFKDLEAELESHRKALEKISVTVDSYNLSSKVISVFRNQPLLCSILVQ